MPLGLLKYGLSRIYPAQHHFTPSKPLKKHYDVVIIGGGGHAAATAYNLARYHGITDIAILEKGYLGGGNTARNTAVIRANYLTEEGVTFYRESVKLFRTLSNELDYNIMWKKPRAAHLGNHRRRDSKLSLACRGQQTSRCWFRTDRPPANQRAGATAQYVRGRALSHSRWLVALRWRHRASRCGGMGICHSRLRRGVEVHQLTEATGLKIEAGRIKAVETNRGSVECGCAIQAVAGASSLVAGMAGIKLPIHTYPLQAMVTQPYKPILDPLVSAPHVHVYIQQTSRGEFVIGGGSEPLPAFTAHARPWR